VFKEYFFGDNPMLSYRQLACKAYKHIYFDNDKVNRTVENAVVGWKGIEIEEAIVTLRSTFGTKLRSVTTEQDASMWEGHIWNLNIIDVEYNKKGPDYFLATTEVTPDE
jgi:hypothetical protein